MSVRMDRVLWLIFNGVLIFTFFFLFCVSIISGPRRQNGRNEWILLALFSLRFDISFRNQSDRIPFPYVTNGCTIFEMIRYVRIDMKFA